MLLGTVIDGCYGQLQPLEEDQIEWLRTNFDFAFVNVGHLRAKQALLHSLAVQAIPVFSNTLIDRGYTSLERKTKLLIQQGNKNLIEREFYRKLDRIPMAFHSVWLNEIFHSKAEIKNWYPYPQLISKTRDYFDKVHGGLYPRLWINEFATKDVEFWDDVIRLLESYRLNTPFLEGISFQVNVYERTHYKVWDTRLTAQRVHDLITQIRNAGFEAGVSEVVVYAQNPETKLRWYKEYYQAALEAGAHHWYFWSPTKYSDPHPCAKQAKGTAYLWDEYHNPIGDLSWLKR